MTEADEHEQRLLALEREIIAMREDMEAAIARAEAAERRVAELEEVLRGFEGIGFKPCKDPACYRATLTMMQQAHTALTHTDEASDDRPRADQERYGGGF